MDGGIAYDRINEEMAHLDDDGKIVFLAEVLSDCWCDDYELDVAAAKPQVIALGSFQVFFDLSSWLAEDALGGADRQEDRVIVVFGRSCPPKAIRDAARMRGYLGKTFEVFGHGFDKGHFIAHTLGGDTLDSINWFQQERRLNRGWSVEGKVYREMERYCAAHPGTFLFSRPIYGDLTARPDFLEYGVPREGKLDVRVFDNRQKARG
jgi:hypothetical protein